MRPLERPKLLGIPCHAPWQGTAQRRASFSSSRRPRPARRSAALLPTRRPSKARCRRQRILRLRASRPCLMAEDCPMASARPLPGPSSMQAAPGGEPRGPSAPGPPRMLAEGERAAQARVQGAQAPAGVRGWPRAAKGGPGGLKGAARPLTSLGAGRVSVRTRVCWRRGSRARRHLARQTQRVCKSAPFSLPVVGHGLHRGRPGASRLRGGVKYTPASSCHPLRRPNPLSGSDQRVSPPSLHGVQPSASRGWGGGKLTTLFPAIQPPLSVLLVGSAAGRSERVPSSSTASALAVLGRGELRCGVG